MALVAALTENHSSKTSSKMGLAPTPACLQMSCRDSGMKSSITTLVTFSSSHTATARSGGLVISAQRVFHMFGKPMYPRDRLSFLLRRGRLSAQYIGYKGTTGCAVMGCREKPSIVSRPSDCQQPHESPLEVYRLLA